MRDGESTKVELLSPSAATISNFAVLIQNGDVPNLTKLVLEKCGPGIEKITLSRVLC